MTDPFADEPTERRIATVPLAGHEFQVRELDELQIMHLGRYAKILARDGVPNMDKIDASDRMLKILHSAVRDEAERDKLIELEEAGDVTLRDLISFSRAFRQQDEQAAPAVVRRRGRPRKSA